MFSKVIVLLVALCAPKVYSSAYNSPSVQLFTPTHPSHGHQGDLRYQGYTAIPHVLHDGRIADTHEVAAAKAEHFAAVAAANDHSDGYAEEHRGYSGHGDIRYQGPTAIPHVLHDGHIADTHEVAAAKAEHFAAVATANDHSDGYAEEHRGYSGHGDIKYQGPTAIPHVLHDGHIADTHEVAAAKAEHFAAVATANDHSDGYAEEHRGYSGHGDIRYQGPTAIPRVLHDGHIADTHEVAAAKAEHFAAIAKAQTDGYNHGVHGAHSGTHRGVAPHASSYHGPIAKPHVLHTGYLADTHEVAAAKHHHYQALSAARHQSRDDYHY